MLRNPLSYGSGYLTESGSVEPWPDASTMIEIDVAGLNRIFVRNLPKGMFNNQEPNIVFLDQDSHVVSVEYISGDGGYYTGVVNVPQTAYRANVLQSTNLSDDEPINCLVYTAEPVVIPLRIRNFTVFDKNGNYVGDYTQQINDAGISIKALENYDVIVFGGQTPIFTQFPNGQYYATISDGIQTWYSEMFTVVNDIQPYLKIVWWDNEDFTMDAGTIVYKYAGGTQFRNVLYLQADIAKPEYPFEEEGETRDGYFFPIKQISEKHYRFSFLASEYLLDVMRFIRMADFAYIEKNGQTYNLDTFLITPDWEDNGDVAAVEAEFGDSGKENRPGIYSTNRRRFQQRF